MSFDDSPFAPEKDPLKLVDFADIQPKLDWQWLVDEILMVLQISVFYGRWGCGKTFLMLDLALRIAAGMLWFGRETTPGRVIYVAAEAGPSIGQRISAWKIAHPEHQDLPFSVLPQSIDLCHASAGDVDRLITAIREKANGHPPVFIGIDTVSRVLAGGNENSPEDMGGLVHSLDRLRDELGAHVSGVHHLGKNESMGPRGHSLLEANADTLVEVDHDDATATSTATVKKQRDGENAKPISFKLRQIELGISTRGKSVTSCVVEDVTAPTADLWSPRSPKKKLTAIEQRALELLQNAISIGGKPLAGGPHTPSGHHSVSVDLWRQYYMAGTMPGSAKTDPRYKQLERASDALLSAGVIGIWQKDVWIV